MFYQQDSGLYLTHYRAYDPRTSRWLSRDPFGLISEVNVYDYIGSNPSWMIDPAGLIEISSITVAIGNSIDRTLTTF
jgi:RHS repeat-associated protein